MLWGVWQTLLGSLSLILLTHAKCLQPTPTTGTAAITSALSSNAAAAAAASWEHVNKTCLARYCDEAVNLQQLREIERNMGGAATADPCINFHEYACGNWPRHNPNGKTLINVAGVRVTQQFVDLFEREQRRRMLEVSTPSSGVAVEGEVALERELWTKMLQYYRVCSAAGSVHLRGYFEAMRARGFWDRRQFNWLRSVGELSRYGYSSHFLHLHVKQQNVSYNRLVVDPHYHDERVSLDAEVFAILRDFTTKRHEHLASEFRALELVLEMLFVESLGETVANEFEDIYNNRTESYTLRELAAKCPEIDWQLLLDAAVDRTVQAHELVSVVAVDALRKIAEYLNRPERAEVVFLYTLARFLNYLQEQPHSILKNGVDSHNCIRHMQRTLYLPMTYLFDRAYYAYRRAESDRVIRAVFAQLKLEFGRTLAQNRLQLEPADVDVLQRKLLAIRLNVGNLPYNVTAQFHVDHMHDLNLTQNFYQNHLLALLHSYGHQRFLLDASEVAADGATQNPWHSFNYHMPDFPDNVDGTPYYHCLSNMIVVPHAYLQRPFYDERFWPALLYGDLANTLGHELMHAFDSNFLQYDAHGNYDRAFLKRIERGSQFNRLLECLQDGTEFLTERIADISGTRLALNTFMRDANFRRRNGKLFFLQFAQFFCGNTDGASFHSLDPDHDEDSVRLIYTLQQTPEFAEAFNCPAGSAMNPPTRCQLW